MTKWIWYGNAAIAGIAVLILLAGWARLSNRDTARAAGLDFSTDDRSTSGAASAGDSSEAADSALVASVKLFSKRWEPPRGSVLVQIAPAQLLKTNKPRWRVGTGPWQEAGAVADKLLTGNHTVEFEPVEGWIKPANQTVEIKNKQVAEITGTYTLPPPMGSLQVHISPESEVKAKAKWRVDNQPWQDTAAVVADLAVGPHTVTFSPIPGWNHPAPIPVTIEEDQTTRARGRYRAQPKGSLRVVIDPNQLAGQDLWRLSGQNGQSWQKSGSILDDVLAGTYAVEFKELAGWKKPEPPSVPVDPNQTTLVQARYEPLPAGSLRVTIQPAEALEARAQWRLDGGPWQDSGFILDGILTGEHAVTAKPVSGWNLPENQKITITEGQRMDIELAYTKPPPPAPSFELKATLVMGPYDGQAWIKLPKKTLPEIYTSGESIEGYRLRQIGDGFVVVMREGHSFRLEVPKPKPPSEARPAPPVKTPTDTKTPAGRQPARPSPSAGRADPARDRTQPPLPPHLEERQRLLEERQRILDEQKRKKD
ncbi:MAG: hypothetical protein JW810_07290 [Sedimentisphaerales bacterium]|nr:hypothetical protein [Sedimentisphaerales bacterium]